MKTVDDLIAHCENVIKCDWKYVYGAKGQQLSKDQILALQKQYGKENVPDSDLSKAGKYWCHCSGLISSCVGGQNYKNTTWFRENAKVSKPINERNSSMKGWAVYRKGHIGVYDGNDGYYAMDGSSRNMVHYNLSKNNFTEIIKLSDINYDKWSFFDNLIFFFIKLK